MSTLAPHLPRHARGPLRPARALRILVPLVVGAGLVVFGLLVAVQPIAAAGLVVAGLGVVAAVTRPQTVGWVSIAVLGLVPVYAAPAA